MVFYKDDSGILRGIIDVAFAYDVANKTITIDFKNTVKDGKVVLGLLH